MATGGRFESICCHLFGLEKFPLGRILSNPPENDHVWTFSVPLPIITHTITGDALAPGGPTRL
jgi:hypothetical protein